MLQVQPTLKHKGGYSVLLIWFPRGQCILPFHCSIVCSLSSSCLSEIWGGGWGGEEEYKSARSQRAAALIKVCHCSETVSSPHQPPQGRTKCECTGDLVPLPQRCGIQDRWPAFWTGGPVLDSLLWQQREQRYCGKNARAITSFWKPSTELITSPYDLGNTAENVKICFFFRITRRGLEH